MNNPSENQTMRYPAIPLFVALMLISGCGRGEYQGIVGTWESRNDNALTFVIHDDRLVMKSNGVAVATMPHDPASGWNYFYFRSRDDVALVVKYDSGNNETIRVYLKSWVLEKLYGSIIDADRSDAD